MEVSSLLPSLKSRPLTQSSQTPPIVALLEMRLTMTPPPTSFLILTSPSSSSTATSPSEHGCSWAPAPKQPSPFSSATIPRFPPRRYPAIFSHHRRPVDPFSISKGTRFWKTQLSKRDSPPRSQMKMATSEARARKRSSFCCWEQSRIIRLGFSRRSSRRRLSGWRR